VLAASGGTQLSSDSLCFTTTGQRPSALGVLFQGDGVLAAGVTAGQGIRCVGGNLVRLFTKQASAGSIRVPDYGSGEATVSARSAKQGDLLHPGDSRWYLVLYRDPIVLGGCPGSSTFNTTQSGRIDWLP
jgi:hypothetical protein